ncbi:pyrroline-5-carboxylate reductase dimerization domain-containing protein [Lactobacillus sp. ESL0679]|uniref:pyrroline-5-carboxylate reductase family protein n=1 Tax=Lactobacillus sp. ESL0679 TaxID=2983209 RepID=UPI0023F6BD8A|nr:pyrroline-5-carboxylate reductase dimerization domain-containing protein [Lactobacillus sp. ESL0679]MDF7682494.1 pyrroline-5-carboxylate reductase dimerization domain-containing protein [Lactobacillus sp. ESL0679]
MKIGFIGAGKIGSSMILGLLQAGISGKDLYVFDGGHQSAQKLAAENSLQLVDDYTDFNGCTAVVVAVGGPVINTILQKLGQIYHGIMLSTGGGDLVKVNQEAADDTSFAKIVPNTPVQIGEGITAVSFIPNEKQTVIATVKEILGKFGDVYVVPESLLGIYGTVSGCAPAYVDLMIEAFSDAAVQNGVKRAESYPMIEKMILGTAKLALTTKKLPEELKDEVTTPGGTTIKGVVKLEEAGFRNALIQAINASAN